MTREELYSLVSELKEQALESVKLSSPFDTGNLRDSVYAKDLPDGGFEIYIDTAKAPYAIYTLEAWVSPYWNGKKNPNERWDDEATSEFKKILAAKLRGVK